MDEMMQRIHGGIMGLAIGDALGVPAEFMSRLELRDNPVTKMRGGGAHGQKAGTWSDDTSITLCLANILANTGSINPQDIMEEFLAWLAEGAYTANSEVFDIGNTCGMAWAPRAVLANRKFFRPITKGLMLRSARLLLISGLPSRR